MTVQAPRVLVEKRLQALHQQLPAALSGAVEGVHQARVASRRLRELLPILPPSEGHVVARILRRDVRQITRALGPVRELDVSLILLGDLASAGTPPHAAVNAVRRVLERQRTEAFSRMLATIDVISLDRLSEASLAMAEAAATRTALRRCRMLLARRLAARTAMLASSVEAAGLLYAADRIHAVRISVKKLRYAVEIAQELRGAAAARVLSRLKIAQDLLGGLHDLQVLVRRIRDAKSGPERRQAQFEDLAMLLDHRVRLMHGEFLKLRPTLDVVYDRCRHIRSAVAPPQKAGRGSRAAVERRA